MAALERKRKRKSLLASSKRKIQAIHSNNDDDTPIPLSVEETAIVSGADIITDTITENDVTGSHGDDDNDILSASSCALRDPFVIHCDRLLQEAEVESLKELYSQPLDLKKVNSELGVVSWLTTPISNSSSNDWSPVTDIKQLNEHHIREPLASLWQSHNNHAAANEDSFSYLQCQLFNILNSYKDLFYSNCSITNEAEIRSVCMLHALNHVIKNRSRVRKNNTRLSLAAKEGRDLGEIRDQGITRPKVLILVPFRDSALKLVQAMIQLLVKPGKGEVANKKKFFKLFGQDESNDSKLPEYKPDSYHHIFSGNIDDCFRVGLTVKKYHLNLFTPFYASDIIIASPLGLRTIIGGEGDKERDYDFLSSIELVILSQADIFLMQNWDHVLHIFNHLHLQPVDGHGVDFSRVREWSLNCWCRYYSQLVLFCSFPTPEINSLFNSYARNYEGQVRVHAPLWVGSVNDIVWGAPQTLHRLKCSDHLQLPDIRFQYFINVILPRLGDGAVSHVCIYIPSYFDYVRLRNHFTKEDHSFCHISEYSSNSDVSRARAYFKSGRKKFLLITERVHFFRRYHLTDIKNIVFYGPPTYCEFYPELINFMVNTDDSGKVILMYSKFDVLAMKRLLGNERTRTLINSTDNIHTLLID